MSPERREKWRRSVTALPPADWHPAPPDFVGIGIQKAGTSWWYRLIEGHPEVFSAHWQKERHFFDGFGRREFTDDHVRQYAELFYRPFGGIAGEWTPRYMCDFWVAGLLHRAAPKAKLLVMLRDPVTRYPSGVRYSLASKVPLSVAQRDAYFRGLYHEQLANYLRYFDASQILVQLYERCVADPLSEIRRTFEFLGVDSSYVPVNVEVRYNESTGPPFAALPHVVAELTELYRDDVAKLAAAFPELDLGCWPSFA